MNSTLYHLKVTFTTSPLGTQPQKDVATEFITSKAIDPETGALPEDELETLPDAMEKGTTAFHKLNGQPILYDYMVKGFLKEVGGIFNGAHGVEALKSKLDNLLFITPRQIPLHLPEGSAMTYCERPLRAMTAQGPRTSLARSEELPVGTWFECDLEVFSLVVKEAKPVKEGATAKPVKVKSQISEALLRDLLDYGSRKGMCQWRNGGHGRLVYELIAL
jgi:hypothetical protein